MAKMSMETYNYKRSALCAARDLQYGEKYIRKIKESTDANEIAQIMTTARNAQ